MSKIITKMKAFLEKYPLLNKIVRKIYIPLAHKYISLRQYLRRYRLGEWWVQREGDWAEGYWDSREHPHRSFLVERIAAFSPISSILEIGSASGPNLYLLAKRLPHSEIRGVEINPYAVEVGNERFSREGILNVRLSVGRAEDLSEFQDNSFDIVFTDAILLCVSRDKIYGTIKKMVRIARKGLIFVEWHDFDQRFNDTRGLGVFTNGYWVRDYVALLKQFVPEEQIRVTKITESIWPDEGWMKNGALIEVLLSPKAIAQQK
ncbi:class I SAM-dependent methyltransferase [Chloroflexota bacterium]